MLTVYFSTYNGARTLGRVLAAYGQLQEPDGGWKLVAIDNGSTDDTLAVLESYRRALPLTVLIEPRRGKNVALNSGIGLLEGDLAVFTDDDAIPSTRWLQCLRNCADERPDYDIFGGAILPAWDTQPPEWIERCVPQDAAFALRHGQEDGAVQPHSLFGPNMALRASVFHSGMRFNETIGPKGSNYAMGSETELLMRLHALGHKAWFSAQATVSHIIRSYQLEPAWLFGRARRFGRGMYRLSGQEHERPALLAGVPRWMIRAVLTSYARQMFERCRLRRDSAFAARWETNVLLGMLTEANLSEKSRRSASTVAAMSSGTPERV